MPTIAGNESLVVFKCGPFIGHKAVQEFAYDPGGGHVHPDANHFVIFGAGEWLVRDDGYRAKWTGQHNTLLVDGKGQLGEGQMWFNGSEPLRLKARPRITRATSAPTLDHVVGDGAEAYPRNIGLRRYTRHVLFLKPDVLIVADDILLDEPRMLELRFHPEATQADREDGAFIMRGKQAVLRFEELTGEGVSVAAEDLAAAGREGERDSSLFTLRLSADRSHWRNAVAFSWAKTEAKPTKVTWQAEGDTWRFTAGPRAVSLDWKTGKAR